MFNAATLARLCSGAQVALVATADEYGETKTS